ncbi:MAG: hypothetical protein AAFN93_26980 [Bacteroidota bacterium]
MTQKMTFFSLIALMISGSCFGQGESNFRHPGVEKLLMNSAEYGFVMDNQCGTVLKTSFSDGKLIFCAIH